MHAMTTRQQNEAAALELRQLDEELRRPADMWRTGKIGDITYARDAAFLKPLMEYLRKDYSDREKVMIVYKIDAGSKSIRDAWPELAEICRHCPDGHGSPV